MNKTYHRHNASVILKDADIHADTDHIARLYVTFEGVRYALDAEGDALFLTGPDLKLVTLEMTPRAHRRWDFLMKSRLFIQDLTDMYYGSHA